MSLDSLRARAIEALRVLRTAQTIAVPSELKVEPLCNALLAVRDLLAAYGDAIVPHPPAKERAAVLAVFAEHLPGLVLALEVVASRSEAILELRDTNPPGDGRGMSVANGDALE